jgi:hypothetical protein
MSRPRKQASRLGRKPLLTPLDSRFPGRVKTILFSERPRFIASPRSEQTQILPEFSHGLFRGNDEAAQNRDGDSV